MVDLTKKELDTLEKARAIMRKVGGRAAAAKLTPAERTARAKKAAAASAKVRTEKAKRRKTDPAAP